MNEETRAVLARIPEEVIESFHDGESYSVEFKHYENVGRQTTALLIRLQEVRSSVNEELPYDAIYTASVAAANEAQLTFTSISDEDLAELVYVIQPEEMEPLSLPELVALFYAYCGALCKAEMTCVESPRGVMAVAELLLSLDVINAMPLFDHSEHTGYYICFETIMPPSTFSRPPSFLESKISKKFGYTFKNSGLLIPSLSVFNRRLVRYRSRIREIGRRIVEYVAAVNRLRATYYRLETLLAGCLMNHRLHRRLYSLIGDSPELYKAIAEYPTRLCDHPHDVITYRATTELANAMLAIIGAVFVDSDFTTAATLVRSFVLPPLPPQYLE